MKYLKDAIYGCATIAPMIGVFYFGLNWLTGLFVGVLIGWQLNSWSKSAQSFGFLDWLVAGAFLMLITISAGFVAWANLTGTSVDISSASWCIAGAAFLILIIAAVMLRLKMTPEQYADYNSKRNSSRYSPFPK